MAFLQLFSTKNAENEDFDQRLGCAAPKRWLKYTTCTALHFHKFVVNIKYLPENPSQECSKDIASSSHKKASSNHSASHQLKDEQVQVNSSLENIVVKISIPIVYSKAKS